MQTRVRVWDLPTRIFHWMLLPCVLGSLITAQIGGAAMTWHFRFGYTILSLLLFRLIWGFIGGHWSRFARFIYSPRTTLDYLRGQGRPEHAIGHTPLGALSVWALLVILLAQAVTGLTSDDDISFAGPLINFVSSAWVNNTTFYHTNVGKPVLITLLILHTTAIIFYHVGKRQSLIRPMLDGYKELVVANEGSQDTAATRAKALGIFLACAWLVALIASHGV